MPHLITHVTTTDATQTDIEHTEAIHQTLASADRLPGIHLVDAGYVDAGLHVGSQEQYEVTLLGPVSQNNQWQAKAAQGYDLPSFQIDWQAKQTTCPQGKRDEIDPIYEAVREGRSGLQGELCLTHASWTG